MDEPASYFLTNLPFWNVIIGSVSAREAILKLGAVLILVLLNGFFVCAEFALVSVRRAKLTVRAGAGSRRARAALRLLNNPTIFISSTQLGITLSSLALGWLGEPTVEALLVPIADKFGIKDSAAYVASHIAATVFAFTFITFLHIVLGELMPKMIALDNAEKWALNSARPIELFAKTFRAPIWVLNTIAAGIGKLLGLKSSLEHAAVYTHEELRQLVEISHKSGHLRADERQLINRVFEFSDTLVREAMVPRTQVAAVSRDLGLDQIAIAFRQYGYSRLPVYGESLDDIIGFLHSKDVMPHLLNPEGFRLENVLQPPLYVVDTARLEDVLRQMQKAKVHFGFVVDEHGGVEGIITLDDLLEEIVGDISDEHDEEVNVQIQETGDGIYMLDGALAVRDINRRLNISLPESDGYTTIAGFLMTEAGHILQPHEVVNFNGLVFKIEKVEKRRVVRVRLERRAEPVIAVNSGQEQNASAPD